MDITFILCPNIIGVFALSILLIFTKFNFYLKDYKLNLFRVAAVVNMAIILFETADYLLGVSAIDGTYMSRRFTSAAGFALSPIFAMLIAHIASEKALPKPLYIPAAVNFIISYASIITGHLFNITSENSYSRGPLFLVMVAISVFYLFVLIYISFKNLRRLRYGESGFLICIVLAMLFTNALEIIWSFHFVIWNVCAILLISYYLFLHIQYFKYDPLTRVLNRAMFDAELAVITRRSNIGIISFDLDNLKKLNDTQGHEAGDEYIKSSAELIDRCFFGTGHLYRVGGDEFVVLISNTTEQAIAEKLEHFKAECDASKLSISCGSAFNPTATDITQLLRDADKAMYENKRQRHAQR